MYPEWILNNKENYKYILKHNNEYSKLDSLWKKNFTCFYGSNDKGLQKLKEQYNLERLMQGRTDLEICLRAMEWTFQQLLGRTQGEYSGPLNADDIIKHCRSTRTTVNCLCHATVLTEVLLALGYSARKVSCLPIDVVPFDNHVVTIVYVPSIKKWIMLDPSMCCYITDAKKKILSIAEIRNCLINDEKINVCAYSRFSNLNISSSQALSLDYADYIAYMFKNMFRFISRYKQNSIATKEGDVFYMLVPKGYLPANRIQKLFIEEAEVEMRITDNDDFFWKYDDKSLGGTSDEI